MLKSHLFFIAALFVITAHSNAMDTQGDPMEVDTENNRPVDTENIVPTSPNTSPVRPNEQRQAPRAPRRNQQPREDVVVAPRRTARRLNFE